MASSANEGLLCTVANHNQKKRSATVTNDKNDKIKKKKNLDQKVIGIVGNRIAKERNKEIGVLVKKLSSPSKEKRSISLVNMISSPTKERKMGAKKWMRLEIAHFLETAGALLPAGRDQ